jgi:putative transposase
MKKRFTEEQIVRILQEAEAGMLARDVCRKHNVSEQTFYRWKSKYGGMDVSEVKRLKELENEKGQCRNHHDVEQVGQIGDNTLIERHDWDDQDRKSVV